MKISDKIFNDVLKTQGNFVEKLSGVPARKATSDFLNPEKPKEQINLLKKYLTGELKNKKLLEIGSGLGVFNVIAREEFGIDAWGVEPSSEGFGGSFETSIEILKENGLSTEKILDSHGEALPFGDNTFDIIYSTSVLEHVSEPKKVIQEAIRVCKHGGLVQIIVPNYGSFYDGHYACFYLPYQPKWLWKLYTKYILRKDSFFIDTLRTEINYFTVNKWLSSYLDNNEIEVLTYGEEIFKERMNTLNFSSWAGLYKVKRIVLFVQKIKLADIIARLMIITKSYTPIILTFRKR